MSWMARSCGKVKVACVALLVAVSVPALVAQEATLEGHWKGSIEVRQPNGVFTAVPKPEE